MTKKNKSTQNAQKTFVFEPKNLEAIKKLLKQYPEDRRQSALLPTLWLAQRQNQGWLSKEALLSVAEILHVPFVRVFEVASFYTMFRTKPVGRHFIQICRTTSCWLRGSDELTDVCRNVLKTNPREVTKDGKFSYEEVECLGACCNAPMVQINDDYYEDLKPQDLENIIDKLQNDKPVKAGSQLKRKASKAHNLDAYLKKT